MDELLERKDARLFAGKEYYATVLSCGIWKFSLFAEDLSPQQTLQYLMSFTRCAARRWKNIAVLSRVCGMTA